MQNVTMSPADQRLVARALKVLEQHIQYSEGPAMMSPAAVRDYLHLRMGALEREEFHVLYLNSQNRLIEAVTEFVGTLTQTSVYPREIVKRALNLNAAAIVIAHNHPSGVAEPSPADRLLTETLKKTLAMIEVPVLDHLIVGADRCFSFAEAGII